MAPISEPFAEKIEKLTAAERKAIGLSAEIERLTGIAETHQGPVFRQGEILDVKGGKFVIRKIIKKGLVLHGVGHP